DGGTRTASITGACVALHEACSWLLREGRVERTAIESFVAAVSVGIVGGVACLDLDYPEDSRADSDFNLVALEDGRFVEVQGTAEQSPFSRDELNELLGLGEQGIRMLFDAQKLAIAV
ncbi:MAG: ribonuclease PH, partial [Gemmatimonadetes bacterium]|nr:ribonuclease PH [Gemmatimonadota bacterium]